MFENLVMLAGIGGAALPLIIHLLNRARYRNIDWGAMMFLEQPGRRNREHAGRLREWTLLGVRMAIVAALAVALARPVFGGLKQNSPGGLAGQAAASDARAAVAVVVDCSASMAHADGAAPPRI